jgi:membrane protease YdiL (CAAX protease family)
MDKNVVDWKRVCIYIAFACGFAWLAALGIYLTGGLAKSPYALLLLAVGYMGAPTLAHILTRLLTREGWGNLYLRPKFRQNWRYWAICWVAPVLFAFAGMAIFFVIFPQYYDPSFATLRTMMEKAAAAGQTMPAIEPWVIVLSQTATALLIAPVLNALPTLGEEFGWRAYLQPKLMPLGGRKAMLLTGIVWGLWHAPVIAMGHNYGLEYPGAPWLGILAMTWFTFVLGTFIGWAALRAGSVWPAVIGHGAINGIAGIYVFFMQGAPNLTLGPGAVGFIGSLAISVAALLILVWRDALKPKDAS